MYLIKFRTRRSVNADGLFDNNFTVGYLEAILLWLGLKSHAWRVSATVAFNILIVVYMYVCVCLYASLCMPVSVCMCVYAAFARERVLHCQYPWRKQISLLLLRLQS